MGVDPIYTSLGKEMKGNESKIEKKGKTCESRIVEKEERRKGAKRRIYWSVNPGVSGIRLDKKG